MGRQLNLTVCEEDILRIGHTWFNEEGNLSIVACTETAGIESILLRNILLCFGDGYVIMDEEDFEWENGDIGILFKTSLPYERFEEVSRG